MKTSRLIAVCLVAVFCLSVVLLIVPQLPIAYFNESKQGYSGFIEIWHIESFEGGSGSRATWLKARAAEFEKQNTGLLIHITVYTHVQAQQKLAEGEKFDLISFSYGLGNSLLPHVVPYSGAVSDVYGSFLEAGAVEGAQFAVPYSSGVYGLFARQSDLDKLAVDNFVSGVFNCAYNQKLGKNTIAMSAVGCGVGEFNSPLSALAAATTAKGKLYADQITQYQAYQKFVANRDFTVLLGSQRDMFRLKNRMTQGKISQLAFFPLAGFCDLIQFAAVSKLAKNREACAAFIEHLISEKAQKKLTEIAMFSVCSLNLYSDEWYTAAEKALAGCKTVNVFSSDEIILALRTKAQAALAG